MRVVLLVLLLLVGRVLAEDADDADVAETGGGAAKRLKRIEQETARQAVTGAEEELDAPVRALPQDPDEADDDADPADPFLDELGATGTEEHAIPDDDVDEAPPEHEKTADELLREIEAAPDGKGGAGRSAHGAPAAKPPPGSVPRGATPPGAGDGASTPPPPVSEDDLGR